MSCVGASHTDPVPRNVWSRPSPLVRVPSKPFVDFSTENSIRPVRIRAKLPSPRNVSSFRSIRSPSSAGTGIPHQLALDPRQCVPLGLGLDDADRLAARIEEVVGL